MSYKLTACQICGANYPIVLHDLIEKYYRCKCENCHAHTGRFRYEIQAVQAWNNGEVEVEW